MYRSAAYVIMAFFTAFVGTSGLFEGFQYIRSIPSRKCSRTPTPRLVTARDGREAQEEGGDRKGRED